MRQYAALYQLDEEETESFVQVLCEMDNAYLESKGKGKSK